MDFFSAQHDARRRTRLLIVLFLLSLIWLLSMANLILYFIFESDPPEPIFYIGVSVVILLIVLSASFFKSLSLRQGGEAVAQMLNARLLAAPSTVAEQRLLNVVEEMAIASGTPVPPVYIMEEAAINAFAAGHSINDAVVGITRGAVNKLSRDELQGVIAHEFSHILHGDMRLNLRLIAWLHGIMVLGVTGHYVLRAASTSRRGNNNAGVAVFGLGLILLGASGNFFGGLIKAAVSRQREYLADASAVQYTRNPRGIAGALKRIAVDDSSPVLANPAIPQISHSLFSEGVQVRFNSLFATHPPLEKRIRVLDPQWNGEYHSMPFDQPPQNSPSEPAPHPGVASLAVALAIARAGTSDDLDVDDARRIHHSLPEAFVSAAHNPLGASAIICLLLMQEDLLQLQTSESDPYHTRQMVLSRLPPDLNAAMTAEMSRLHIDIIKLEARHRLPMINICLGTLRQLSPPQYQNFRQLLSEIVAADISPDITTWVLFQLVTHHLDRTHNLLPATPLAAQTTLAQSSRQLEVFFSLLSHCGHRSALRAESAFVSAANDIGISGHSFIAAEDLDITKFQQATTHLAKLVESDKKRLLSAMSICVYHDQKLTVSEHELIKMASEMLDWPLPAKILR